MRKNIFKILFGLLVLFSMAASSVFIVDETQIIIVSQFGNPRKVIENPGLYVKAPAPIQTLFKFDKRLAIFNSRPSEFLTQDKKNIVVESYLCWRIADAKKFLQTVKDRNGAEIRLGDMINSELGNVLGTVPLSALVSTDPATLQSNQIMKSVTDSCGKKALTQYGIEVVEAEMKRLNFPEQNKSSVYNRMRSERERIARKYRAEGKEKADTIKAQTDKDVSLLLSEAYSKAEAIKGEGDAKAARIYAEAYNKDPQFYRMTRTLESYTKFLDNQTTLVLSSDAEILKVLQEGGE